jgi:D-aminopeptidase
MTNLRRILVLVTLAAGILAGVAAGQTKARARDLGIPLDGTPGAHNAITDVPGVEVGMTTLISGEGKLVVGKGPVRTGVTAILPRGNATHDQVYAAWFTLNGNGELTGTTWVEESGFLGGPVMITNTHSVGVCTTPPSNGRSRTARNSRGRCRSSGKPGTAA